MVLFVLEQTPHFWVFVNQNAFQWQKWSISKKRTFISGFFDMLEKVTDENNTDAFWIFTVDELGSSTVWKWAGLSKKGKHQISAFSSRWRGINTTSVRCVSASVIGPQNPSFPTFGYHHFQTFRNIPRVGNQQVTAFQSWPMCHLIPCVFSAFRSVKQRKEIESSKWFSYIRTMVCLLSAFSENDYSQWKSQHN